MAWGAAMMTFTMAHSYDGNWKESIDLLHAAFKVFDKNMSRRYKAIGCMGKLKSLEAPVGVHGIHGHFHVLLTHLLGADLTAFEALARAEWEKAVAQVGGKCNDHGFDLKLNAMADYLAKQELAHEMSNHDTKKARKRGLLLGQLLDRAARGDAKASAEWLDPSKAMEKAPESFEVKFSTTKGDFIVEAKRDWAPNGVDRFYNMVKIGYFHDIVIFRAIPGFMWQFGIHGDPAVNAKWAESKIQDDPPKAGISNQTGFLTFAKTGQPNSRSIQFFVNLGNNQSLDSQGFTPFARVTRGLDVIKKINTEYGENRPDVQANFQAKGNDYVLSVYPNLDKIKSATLVTAAATANE